MTALRNFFARLAFWRKREAPSRFSAAEIALFDKIAKQYASQAQRETSVWRPKPYV